MSVTVKDVEYIAALARLTFSETEKVKFTHHLNQILEYVEQLKRLNTNDIEPLAQVIEFKNVFRQDEVQKGLQTQDALKNASSKTESFVKVPKVIGE